MADREAGVVNMVMSQIVSDTDDQTAADCLTLLMLDFLATFRGPTHTHTLARGREGGLRQHEMRLETSESHPHSIYLMPKDHSSVSGSVPAREASVQQHGTIVAPIVSHL